MKTATHDANLMRAVAAALRPRVWRRPSEWVRENVRVRRTMGFGHDGAYDPGHYPWLAAFLDALYDRPWARGVIVPKPSQRGITVAMLAYIAAVVTTKGGNVLYLMGKEDEAKEQAAGRLWPILQAVPALRERLGHVDTGDRRTTGVLSMPYDEGVVRCVTAGSAPSASSNTYPVVVCDELDQAEAAFRRTKTGTLIDFLRGRFSAVPGGGELWLFSHPTTSDRGIWKAYQEMSDQGRWVSDCPHCSGVVDWDPETCVVFRRTLEDGTGLSRVDPDSGVVVCPACGCEISTEQRQRMVWPESKGGTGRLWSPLADEGKPGGGGVVRREFVGFRIDGLADPYRSNRELTRLIGEAKHDEVGYGTVLNVQFGRVPRPKGAAMLTQDRLAAMLGAAADGSGSGGGAGGGAATVPALVLPRHGVPGGGVVMVTAGVDVQAPQDNPRFYVALVAHGLNGERWVVRMERMQGWDMLRGWLAAVRVMTVDGEGKPTGNVAPLVAVGIDDRYLGGQVKGFCRQPIYAHQTAQRVELVPVGFIASSVLNRDHTWQMRSEQRRVDPERPDLGLLPMYDLHRHSWVDRMIMAMAQGEVTFRAGAIASAEEAMTVKLHLSSQVQTPKRQASNWDTKELEWDKAKDRPDDYLMALTYAEAVAVVHRKLPMLREGLRLRGLSGGGMGGAQGATQPRIQAPTIGRR
ncbi:MAG: phage terminase large subunit family protein [Phycisphaerales bacterium]|nr:phage terminase large subunit family protein [Phycisphaerales bacterium]